MEYAWIVWILIAVVLFIFEAVTVTLTSIWFAVGALVTAVISYFTQNIWIQILCFLLLSALLLVLTRPVLAKRIKRAPTNSDSMIGKQVLVIKKIDNVSGGGQVKYNAAVWTAKSADNSIIEEGRKVTVQEIKGVSLIVK